MAIDGLEYVVSAGQALAGGRPTFYNPCGSPTREASTHGTLPSGAHSGPANVEILSMYKDYVILTSMWQV